MSTTMCAHCGGRPRYFDGRQYSNYCGRTCQSAAQSYSIGASLMPSTPMCTVPGCNRPAWRNPQGQYTAFCGKRCRDNNPQFSQQINYSTPTAGTGSLGSNACIVCKVRPYNKELGSLFCGLGCIETSEAMAPGIIQVPNDHPKFQSVAHQFQSKWLHGNKPVKPVRYIYLIVGNGSHVASYKAYRNLVESQGNFAAKGLPRGNQNRRFHGTTRNCHLGEPGNTQLCTSTDCGLCGIIRTSFDLKFYKKKTSWGRFGRGIYTSATSSKSDSYTDNNMASPYKAMLLNKVVVGKGCKLTNDHKTLTAPPSGYDSVIGEPAVAGDLNYDELVVYDNDAIRPVYLILY